MIFDNFKNSINYERILNIIECYPKNEQYENIKNYIFNLENIFFKNISPICIYNINNDKNSKYYKCIFVIYSIRGYIDEIYNKLFDDGEYIKGIIINAMADDFIMSMEKNTCKYIENFCMCNNIGVIEKYIPGENIPLYTQYDICKYLKSEKYGIYINDSYVIKPTKSLSFILKTAYGEKNIKYIHNCSKCKIKYCRWKNK